MFALIGCLGPDDATLGDTFEVTNSSMSELSSVGGDISAAEILDRARFWFQLCNDSGKADCTANQMWYTTQMSGDSDFHADPQGKQYRKDCSGLVSMALHLDGSLVTSTLPGVLTLIAIDDLQPGDVIDSPVGGHAFLFEEWGDSAHSYYYSYDFGTTPVRHLTVFRSGSDLDTSDGRTFYAYHYPKNINATVKDKQSAPDLLLANGTIAAYTIRPDGTMWGASQSVPGGAFNPWQQMPTGPTFVGEPQVLQLTSGIIAIYARTTTGAIMGTNQNAPGGSFYPWISLGGNLASDPTVLQLANGAMAMYATAPDHNVWGISQAGPGGSWGSWQLL
jgi:hypothetical protein